MLRPFSWPTLSCACLLLVITAGPGFSQPGFRGINGGVVGNPGFNPGGVVGNPGMNFRGGVVGNPGFNPGGVVGNPGFNPGGMAGNPGFNPGGVVGNPGFNPGGMAGNPGFNPGGMAGNPGFNPGGPNMMLNRTTEKVWICDQCKAVVGHGDTPPAISNCPTCGIAISNFYDGTTNHSRSSTHVNFFKIGQVLGYIFLSVLAIALFLALVRNVSNSRRSSRKPKRSNKSNTRRQDASRDDDDVDSPRQRRSRGYDTADVAEDRPRRRSSRE